MAKLHFLRSGLSQSIDIENQIFRIEIIKLAGDVEWTLEVVLPNGVSVVWDEPFQNDYSAFDAALAALQNKNTNFLGRNDSSFEWNSD